MLSAELWEGSALGPAEELNPNVRIFKTYLQLVENDITLNPCFWPPKLARLDFRQSFMRAGGDLHAMSWCRMHRCNGLRMMDCVAEEQPQWIIDKQAQKAWEMGKSPLCSECIKYISKR